MDLSLVSTEKKNKRCKHYPMRKWIMKVNTQGGSGSERCAWLSNVHRSSGKIKRKTADCCARHRKQLANANDIRVKSFVSATGMIGIMDRPGRKTHLTQKKKKKGEALHTQATEIAQSGLCVHTGKGPNTPTSVSLAPGSTRVAGRGKKFPPPVRATASGPSNLANPSKTNKQVKNTPPLTTDVFAVGRRQLPHKHEPLLQLLKGALVLAPGQVSRARPVLLHHLSQQLKSRGEEREAGGEQLGHNLERVQQQP